MSRRYTPEEQTYALQCLVAQGGHVATTARILAIPHRTLYRWKQQNAIPSLPPASLAAPPLPQELPHSSPTSQPLPQKNRLFSTATATATISPQTTATPLPQTLPLPQAPPENTYEHVLALRDLQNSLLEKAARILATVEPEKAAHLPQRIMAVARLTDRVLKLTDKIYYHVEPPEEEPPVIQFIDPPRPAAWQPPPPPISLADLRRPSLETLEFTQASHADQPSPEHASQSGTRGRDSGTG